MLKTIIVGLGNQAQKDHIPAVLRRKDLRIVALVDTNRTVLKTISDRLDIKPFTDVREALKKTKPDIAIVSVPHNKYLSILELLAKNHVATLKEKPLSMSFAEAEKVINLYKTNNTYLQICVQRRFSDLYETVAKLILEIGNIYSIYIEYTLNLTAEDMASGWRADKNKSGGGAVIDMGYHIIDLLTYLFDIPDRIYAQVNYNSIGGGYTIDDTMKAMMTFKNQINTNIVVTKIYNQKNEKVRIFGSEGSVYVDGRKVTLFDKDKNEIESHIFNSKQHEVDRQLDYFVNNYKNDGLSNKGADKLLGDQKKNMWVIDTIYKSNSTRKVINLKKEDL